LALQPIIQLAPKRLDRRGFLSSCNPRDEVVFPAIITSQHCERFITKPLRKLASSRVVFVRQRFRERVDAPHACNAKLFNTEDAI
jgi:hypothetical protein